MTTAREGFSHIVVGTSLTESSLGAIREALRLGERFAAAVSIVHVSRAEAPDFDAQLREHLAGEFIPTQATVRPVLVRGGHVAESLARFARDEGADLICVGPRTHGFVEKHITGGPAEQLISRTALPVLVTTGPSQAGYRTILVALDRSQPSARALQLAHRMLHDARSQLVALHVLAASTGAHKLAALELPTIEDALIDDTREEIAAFVREQLGDAADACVVDVRIGALGHWVTQRVEALGADLVCMGTVGRSGFGGWLAGGNAAERMVGALDVPLLVAHSQTNEDG